MTNERINQIRERLREKTFETPWHRRSPVERLLENLNYVFGNNWGHTFGDRDYYQDVSDTQALNFETGTNRHFGCSQRPFLYATYGSDRQ